MSVSRHLLLRASRSAWLARQLSERAFFRRAVRRFLPGEELGAALDAAAGFARDGIGSVLTELGEQVTTRAEGSRVRDHYLEVLDRGRQRGLPAQISVKLTHLGLDVDRAACLENVRALAARAADAASFLWIDMEESRYVDVTLELFRRARAAHAGVGVCLQAYLRRTSADLEGLLPLAPAIRLVKGAYNEPPDVAFPKKRDVDERYFTLAGRVTWEHPVLSLLTHPASFTGAMPTRTLTATPGALDRWRRDTPGCRDRIHLNNAGAALMPQPVLETLTRHLEREAAIGAYEA